MKKKINIFYFLMAIFTTFALLVPYDFKGLVDKVRTFNFSYFVVGLLFFDFYRRFSSLKRKWSYRILALIFSLLMVFGYSYAFSSTAQLVWKNGLVLVFAICKFIGYYYFFLVGISLTAQSFLKMKLKNVPAFFKEKFLKHPFLFSFVVLFLCYLPYLIAFYPGVINYDAANQIKEVMGIPTRYMDSVILLDESVTLTNFNPILHTFFIGGFFKLGVLLGNVNLGIFFSTFLQFLIVIAIFAYALSYLYREGVSLKILFFVLLFFAFVPVFPFYALTGVKDVLFSSFVLLFVLKLHFLISHSARARDYLIFFLIALLVILLRNNGIYTVLLGLLFLLCYRNLRVMAFTCFVLCLGFYIGFNRVLLPSLHISNTSIREILSIPFQQTARYAKYYEEEFSERDKAIVDQILTFDTLKDRYNPSLSDPVKNEFNKYATREDLIRYFEVWANGLVKRPGVYMNATINNVYGYFYPNISGWYFYYQLNPKLPEAGFDYHFIDSLQGVRQVLSGYGLIFPHIPILGMLVNVGFIVWCYLFLSMLLIAQKRKNLFVLLIPGLSLILVCVVSPANTYFRYILPCLFSLPICFGLLHKELTTKKEVTCS